MHIGTVQHESSIFFLAWLSRWRTGVAHLERFVEFDHKRIFVRAAGTEPEATELEFVVGEQDGRSLKRATQRETWASRR